MSLGSFRSPQWNRAVRRSTIDELARSRRWRFATVLVCREETGSLASGLLLMMNVPPVNARADAAEAETPTRIHLFHATESNFTVLLETYLTFGRFPVCDVGYSLIRIFILRDTRWSCMYTFLCVSNVDNFHALMDNM